jgi:hypothetical protein
VLAGEVQATKKDIIEAVHLPAKKRRRPPSRSPKARSRR